VSDTDDAGIDGDRTAAFDGWRSGMRIALLVFVVLALAALAVTPVLLVRDLDDTQNRTQGTVIPVERLGTELRLQLAQSVAEHRGFMLGRDSLAAAHYRATRASERAVLDSLVYFAHLTSPDLEARATEVGRIAERWYAPYDRVIDGTLTANAFFADAARINLVFDTLASTLAALEASARKFDADQQAAMDSAVDRDRTFSTILGVIALLVAVFVGMSIRREIALTRRLVRAMDEQSRLREESERRRMEVEKLAESKARMTRGFSHDVKNPLGAADGYLQLMQQGLMDPLTTKQADAVARSRRSIATALQLITDLLELARTESDVPEVTRAPMNVSDVVKDAAEEYRAQAEARGLTMHVELPDAAATIQTDEARVRQVLSNLISNAVKYTRQGGVTVSAHKNEGGVEIVVADTGDGIPKDKHHLLFEEFVRLEPSVSPGAGVGLAISSRIVRLLGGSIDVESEPGKGSRFILRLPEVA
jgi:signal transduction histidine kinase